VRALILAAALACAAFALGACGHLHALDPLFHL
jgi:hypothetical protein